MKIGTSKIKNQRATVVSNEFIDQFMAAANGEYVKVYLYILRHADGELTDEQIADALNLTLADVARALKYWEQEGLLGNADTRVKTAAPQPEITPSTGKTGTGYAALSDDQDFSEMLWILQQYLKKPMTQTELESVVYMYDTLQMPRELIEYLTEICVEKKKTSLKYIEAIARRWHEQGIRTVADAQSDAELYSAEIGCVMKAYGIKDRGPGEEELRYIISWFRTNGMSREIVTEACNRTMAAIQKPSFRYTDSILTKWAQAGVRTLADVQKLDKVHEESAKKSREIASRGPYGKYYGNAGDVNAERISANTRINAIKRQYDQLLARERDEQAARVEEVYAKVPRIKVLDEEIGKASLEMAKRSIATGANADGFAEKLAMLKEEKAGLLEGAGFAADYMLMHYTCPDCKDTGFIDGRKCHCFLEKEKETEGRNHGAEY